jgi:predicted PurR-regulated permease PerM
MDDADELDLVAYQSQLQAADGVFRDIKYEILGGPYLGYFKELANPTDDQLHEFINKEASKIQPMLVSITGTTTTWFATQFFNATITILAVYFFLADGPRMVQTVMRLSPLDDRYEQELLDEFVSVSRAVVLATMLSAAAQGLLAGAGYWLAGLDAVFLLTVLTAVLAFVPFVGAFAVWGPVCVWLCFVEERPIAAIVFVVYGAAVISMADNVIKPYVLHGRSRLHPLLALLSVLGGVKALGPIGILVGPLIVAFLQTLLNILHRELTHFDREAAAES